jgi:hypothetical protein
MEKDKLPSSLDGIFEQIGGPGAIFLHSS